jgi:hypothetical protein
MGILSSIHDFLNELDNSSQYAEAAKQQVDTLVKLAEAKAETFRNQIKSNLRTAGTNDNATIPIEAIRESFEETYAYYSDDSDKIKETIKNAITKLSPGTKQDVADGVSTTVTDLIGGFLGQAEGSDKTTGATKVLAEGLSIIRVDFLVWKYNGKSAGLLKQDAHCASAFVLVKSMVDMSKLGLNTFLNVYQNQLKSVMDNKSFEEAMTEANKIYRHFHKITGMDID